jgi:hypothetical protein
MARGEYKTIAARLNVAIFAGRRVPQAVRGGFDRKIVMTGRGRVDHLWRIAAQADGGFSSMRSQGSRGQEEAGAWRSADCLGEASRAQLPEKKGGICVSTVSIIAALLGTPAGVGASQVTAVVANGICRTSGLLF